MNACCGISQWMMNFYFNFSQEFTLLSGVRRNYNYLNDIVVIIINIPP